MKTEIELLREIAKETQILWNRNLLPLNAITLKNLLTERIDMGERRTSQPAADGEGTMKECGAILVDGLCPYDI